MPARVLERYVEMGVKSGAGMLEPSGVAEAVYKIAAAAERVPLRVPLGPTAWRMIKSKHEAALGELEKVKEVSAMGKEL